MSKVSIIIPTFNRALSICDTLNSVISQTYKNVEIIVIDDGSIDNTEAVLKLFIHDYQLEEKLFYYKQKNGGPGKARNLGLKYATGEYIVFFDSDDIMCPDRIEVQLERLIFKNADICAAGFLYQKSKEIQRYNSIIINNYISFYKGGFLVGTQAWMLKTKVVENIGGYNESIRYYEDLDLVFRVLSQGAKLCSISKVLTIFDDLSEDGRLTDAKLTLNHEYIKGLLISRNTAILTHIRQHNYFSLLLEFNLVVNKRRKLSQNGRTDGVDKIDIMIKNSFLNSPFLVKKFYLYLYLLLVKIKGN
ncbi:glycosyltransferase family 2 protein [Pedobacter immunditicola]|uniref:glycosyltransferase family 2 protein n=1 Tax=Pedobacter immunditicola TaxID=3133440 RepID=UPI0030A45DC9